MITKPQGGQFVIGDGRLSGYIAVALASLSLLGVLAFHFPQYLTTPELRQSYDVDVIRTIMFAALVISGALGLWNIIRNVNKRAALIAWVLVSIAIMLGGHRIEVGDFPDHTPYLGLDWFILDLLGSTLIFVFIEKIIPYRKQAVLREEWQTDTQHFLVNHLLISFALLAANQFVTQFFGWAVSDVLQQAVQSMPWWLQLFVVLLFADLMQYSLHRAYHEVPYLWRFHSVHHSVETMDWLAGSRQHFLELVVTRCFVLTPIFVFGFEKSVVDTYIIIVGFQAVFNHANANIHVGWLKYIIVTPQFHHWHHASDKAAIDRNYAAHFSFIDYLFKTAVRGQDKWPKKYGIVGGGMPEGWIKQQAYPFIKSKRSSVLVSIPTMSKLKSYEYFSAKVNMNIELALEQFYEESGFEAETGKRPAFVEVFVGCLLIPLPNIEIRRKYIKYHDLHHVINDFNSSQAGEGEVSAWELGTGSMLHPILMFMNLIAISTALAISPIRVFKAYLVGCKSKNLYCPKVRRRIDSGELNDVEQLKREFLNCRCSDAWIALKMIPFVIFALLSIVIHLILVIPALLYKKVWGRFFQAKLVKVVKVRS